MAMGEAFQQAGAQWGAYAADIQRRQDITEAEESLNKVAEDDAKAYSAFRQLDGKAAVNAFEAFDKDQQQRYKLAAERARNDQQRQWIKQKLGDRRVQVFSQAISHRDGQLANYRLGVADAATKQAVQDAAAFMDSPDRQGYLDKVRQRATEQADLAGVDAEPITKKAISDLHVLISQRLVDADRPGDAVNYVKEHMEQIEPLARGPVSNLVQRAGVTFKAQSLVDDFRARGMDYASQIETAGLLFQQGTLTAEERKEVEERITQADNMDRRGKAAEASDVLTAGEQLLAGNPDAKLSDDPKLYTRAERAGVLPQLLQFERSRRSDTDPRALAEAMSLPDEALANVSRAEIVQRYWGRLTKDDMNAVLSRRDRAAGDRGSSSQGPNVLSIDDRVISSFRRLKGLPDDGALPKDNAVEFQAFRQNVQEQIEAERADGGKVTPQRLQQILDAAKLDTVYKWEPGFFSGGAPTARMMLTDAEELTAGTMVGQEWVPIGSIPADVRAAITQRKAAAGESVREQDISSDWVTLGKPKTLAELRLRNK